MIIDLSRSDENSHPAPELGPIEFSKINRHGDVIFARDVGHRLRLKIQELCHQPSEDREFHGITITRVNDQFPQNVR